VYQFKDPGAPLTFSFTLGTRGSPLALAQAHETRALLMKATGRAETDFPIRVIRTSGDAIQDRALALAGGKGLFTKEIDTALIDGSIDAAVHSAKDLPTALPDELFIAGCLEREDVRDALILREGNSLNDLQQGSVIGTASLRRGALLKRLRPDLNLQLLRGNVGTRLDVLEKGSIDATILAFAGLKRLNLTHHASCLMDEQAFPPAPGQGAIALMIRRHDPKAHKLISSITHEATYLALTAERAFLKVLDGSCRTPIAGLARLEDNMIHFHGLVLRPNGFDMRQIMLAGPADQAQALGEKTGESLKADLPADFFEPSSPQKE
jgi:hydroxymethylbilane synthase